MTVHIHLAKIHSPQSLPRRTRNEYFPLQNLAVEELGIRLGQLPEFPITLYSGHLVVMAVVLMVRRLRLVLVTWNGITSRPLLLRRIRDWRRNALCCSYRIGIGTRHLVSRRYRRSRALGLEWRASRCCWAVDNLSSTHWAGLCDGATIVHHGCCHCVAGWRRPRLGLGLLKLLLHCWLGRRVLRRIAPRWMDRSVRVAAWSLMMPPFA